MSDLSKSTISALLKEKPKPGRPRHAVSRQTVYVELTDEQKQMTRMIAEKLPATLHRADIPDLAITLLTANLDHLKQTMAGREREMPEGVVDLISLYLLWDLIPPNPDISSKWTSIRLSPRQAIQLGRIHGELNALFGATRSEIYNLALIFLNHLIKNKQILVPLSAELTLDDLKIQLEQNYL